MKRFAVILAASLVFLLAIVATQTVKAQAAPLSDEQIAAIRQNCVRAQTTLSQLQKSDAALRVNRGTLYALISSKLMAPLNSRIALNGLGGLSLASTTVEYDKRFDSFRSSYSQYDDSMTHTLAIKCADHPEDFYASLTETREKRQKLHDDTATLTSLLQSYKTDFEAFAKNTSEDAE